MCAVFASNIAAAVFQVVLMARTPIAPPHLFYALSLAVNLALAAYWADRLWGEP